ncbi:hypothetical protein JM420_001251 [Neisseria gonorrhoeae]
MSKDYRNDLYDVYVSYPPQVDRGLIRECLKENLGEEKAEGLIESLDSKPQVLVEEKCTWAKREELHDYFSYLGLDIITRIWSWKRSCRRRRGRAKEGRGWGNARIS